MHRLTPQIVGRAENAHRPVLDRQLSAAGVSMGQWVALVMTAVADGGLDPDQLAAQVTGALKVDSTAARDAVADLMARSLLADLDGEGSRIDLTPAGRALHARVRAAVDEVTARVYADIPAEDLAVSARVLTLITERLNAETAASTPAASPGAT